MTGLSLRDIARALGGEVVRGAVLAPGPNHSRRDRSLSIKISANSPDGFIVFSHSGDDFRDCRDHVRSRLGLPADAWRDRSETMSVVGSASQPEDEDRIARAVAIWHEGREPRGTVVERYLRGRALELDDDVCNVSIRFHPACPWRDEERQETIRVPAMLAAMRQIEGDRLTGVHRTRLSPEGSKIGRRMLGIAAGAVVKLDSDDVVGTSLAIGEGIETTMSGRLLGFRPAWATGSAGGIAKFPVLAGVESLTILTERDETGTNERATNEVGARWHAARREVLLVDPKSGNDLNDAIRGAA